jgi:hypothetical protein
MITLPDVPAQSTDQRADSLFKKRISFDETIMNLPLTNKLHKFMIASLPLKAIKL